MDGRFVDSGIAVIVGDGAKSMCKAKKWTCVFFWSHARQQPMCKDEKLTVCLLTRGLPSLSSTEQNPCVKIKLTCVFLRLQTSQQSMCNDTKWTVGLLTRGLPPLSATEQNPCVKVKRGRAFSLGRRQVNNPCVKIQKWTVGLLIRGLPSVSATEQNPCVTIK